MNAVEDRLEPLIAERKALAKARARAVRAAKPKKPSMSAAKQKQYVDEIVADIKAETAAKTESSSGRKKKNDTLESEENWSDLDDMMEATVKNQTKKELDNLFKTRLRRIDDYIVFKDIIVTKIKGNKYAVILEDDKPIENLTKNEAINTILNSSGTTGEGILDTAAETGAEMFIQHGIPWLAKKGVEQTRYFGSEMLRQPKYQKMITNRVKKLSNKGLDYALDVLSKDVLNKASDRLRLRPLVTI